MRKLLSSLAALAFLVSFIAVPGIAAADETPALSINDAYKQALATHKKLTQMDIEIDRSEIIKDEAKKNVPYNPMMTYQIYPATALYMDWKNKEIEYEKAEKDYDRFKDELAVEVKSKYLAILQAQENIKASEKALEDVRMKERLAKASFQAGVGTALQVSQAKTLVEVTEANLAAAENELVNAWEALNFLIGRSKDYCCELSDRPEFMVMSLDNLHVEVHRALDHSVDLWYADSQVKLLEMQKPWIRPYKLAGKSIDQAKLGPKQIEEALEQNIHVLYRTIRDLEAKHPGAVEAVDLAKEDLRLEKVKFEVGVSTRDKVLAAEKALVEAEKNLFDLLCGHQTAKDQFYYLTGRDVLET